MTGGDSIAGRSPEGPLPSRGPDLTCWNKLPLQSISDSHAVNYAVNISRRPFRYLLRCATNVSTILLPSFLHSWAGRGPSKPERPQNAIAALDGLRGWACLLVFNFHFLFTYTHKTAIGWGLGEDDWGYHQLPIIHMLISGHVMVAIFFVISGYVLSYKPLKLLRSYEWEPAFRTLSSSTFRRAIRLYIPSIVGTFCVTIAVLLGGYNYSTWVRDEGKTILGTNEQHPPIFPTLYEQMWDWYKTVVHLIDPWNWKIWYNFYNPHLWTIPVEFRCSLALFLAILGLSRLWPWFRLVSLAGMISFCVRWNRWDVVLFFSGMMLAELDLICGLHDSPKTPPSLLPLETENGHVEQEKVAPSSSSSGQCVLGRITWFCLFITGLYIGSAPNQSPEKTPGFRYLCTYVPETYDPNRFLQSIGAIIIVCCVNHSRDLQKPFTTSVAQYLGRVSFAFYVVHGPILHSLGYSIMPSIWSYTGKETNIRYCLGFLLGYLACLPVAVWAGDLFWRAVDVPSVKFARWIEQKVTI